jgi:hypothetical protein
MTTVLFFVFLGIIILGPPVVLIIAMIREDPNCEVMLRADKQPTFPYRCVRCSSPDASYPVYFRLRYLRKGSVLVPACERCARKLETRLFLRLVLFWLGIAVFILGIPVGLYLVHRFQVGSDQGVGALLMTVAVIPWLAYRLIFPLPLVLLASKSKDTIIYKWRNANDAAAFAASNGVRPGSLPKSFY